MTRRNTVFSSSAYRGVARRRTYTRPHRGRARASFVGFTLRVLLTVLTVAITMTAIAAIIARVIADNSAARVFTPAERRYLEIVTAQATETARPSAPQGYAISGRRIETPLVFCVDPVGGPQLKPSLLTQSRMALDLWKTAAPGIPVSISGECPGTGIVHDDNNVIGWEHNSEGVIGWAKEIYRSSVIYGGDIALEPDWPRAYDPICTVSTIAHELGHMMGLNHQNDDDQSIMYPYNECRGLVSDRDAAAARHLYGSVR